MAPSSGFQPALSQLCARPFRPQLDDLVEERHADVPAHRHEHRLALQRAGARLEVRHEIRRHFLQPRLRADQLRELRPFALRRFPRGDVLLVLDHFLHVLV